MAKSIKTFRTSLYYGNPLIRFLESKGYHLEFTPDFTYFSIYYEPFNNEDDRLQVHFQLTTLVGLLGLICHLGLGGAIPTLILSLLFIFMPWGNIFINLPLRSERTSDESIYGVSFFEDNLVLRWDTRVKYIPLPWALVYHDDVLYDKGWVKGNLCGLPESGRVVLYGKRFRRILFNWMGLPIYRITRGLQIGTNKGVEYINLNDPYICESLENFLKNK